MTSSYLKFLREILKPRLVKWGGRILAVVAAYDLFSNQFPGLHLLKLGDLLPRWAGMSGSLLPWWGWLLILQAVFVYALFEYVRNQVPVLRQTIRPPEMNTLVGAMKEEVESQLKNVASNFTNQIIALKEQQTSSTETALAEIKTFVNNGNEIRLSQIERIRDKDAQNHQDLAHLLHWARAMASRNVMRVFIDNCPPFDELQCPREDDQRKNQIGVCRSWMTVVGGCVSSFVQSDELQDIFLHVEKWAETAVRQIPPEQRPTEIDPYVFQEYFVAVRQTKIICEKLQNLIGWFDITEQNRLKFLRKQEQLRTGQ